MAPSLCAPKSPLDSIRRERQAIAKLTLAFIGVSFVVHWAIAAAYHPKQVTVEPQPSQTIIVIRETPTPQPTPVPTIPPQRPVPAKHTDATAPPNVPHHPIQPPHQLGNPRPGDSPAPPIVPGSPGPIAPSVAPSEPPASAPPPQPAFAPCRIVRKVEPEYPDMVKQAGIQGTVAIVISIGPNGEVLSAQVGESSGNRALDEAALAAARASSYQCPPAAGRQAELYQVIYRFTTDQ